MYKCAHYLHLPCIYQIVTLAAIRAGSKGYDPDLPASYRKLLKGTGENVAESPHVQIDDQGVKIFCG